MFDMNASKPNNNSVSVNTRLFTSFSDTCQFTLGAWNEQLSLKFAPLKSVDANGIRQYAQDRSEIIATSLTVDNALTLSKGIEDNIKPALAEKKAAEVSVTMGTGDNKKVLKVETDGTDVKISVFLGVNDAGVATGQSITHTFNKREYMTSYDPTTGANESVTVNADFENFAEKVKNIQDLSQAVPHSIKYSNAIKSNYSNNKYNNNTNTQNTANQAPSNTYNNMDEFIPFN